MAQIRIRLRGSLAELAALFATSAQPDVPHPLRWREACSRPASWQNGDSHLPNEGHMPRVRIVALLVVVSTGLLAAQQAPTFRSGTHTVSVYATVVDSSGRLVPNLSKDDFAVFDNDVPQPIRVFDNSVRPITIVIMLDRSGSMRPNFDLEQSAAAQFVTHLLPNDKARVGSFSMHIQIDPETFTSNQDDLIRILYEDLQDPGPTPLWRAISAAMTALARQDDRRVVLVLTDGFDNPMEITNTSFEQVRDRSEAEEIMVYGIGLADDCGAPLTEASAGPARPAFQVRGGSIIGQRGRMGPQPRVGGGRGRRGGFPQAGDGGSCAEAKPDPHLQELAAGSGGGYFELTGGDDLGSTFAQVANELHHQYLLGFTAGELDGQVHRLTVRLRNPDLIARARKSYVAPTVR
jgi:VWFA-related protein